METVNNPIAIHGIRAEDLELAWPQVAPLIQRALEHAFGEILLDDVWNALLEKDMQLWIAREGSQIKACVVTEIIVYPRMKAMRIVALGGTGFDGWKHGWDQIELWARVHGASRIEAWARPGVRKLAEKEFGFKKRCELIEKELFPLYLQ
jgi:hypothetical protein